MSLKFAHKNLYFLVKKKKSSFKSYKTRHLKTIFLIYIHTHIYHYRFHFINDIKVYSITYWSIRHLSKEVHDQIRLGNTENYSPLFKSHSRIFNRILNGCMKSISKEIYLTLTNLGFSPIYLNLCVQHLPTSARTMFLKEIH